MAAEPAASTATDAEADDVVCDVGLKPEDMTRRRW